jgi:hypothetical protein
VVDDVNNFKTLGGVPRASEFEGYPGDKMFIKHLEQSYDFKYRTGKIKKVVPVQESTISLKRLSKANSNLTKSFPRSQSYDSDKV